MSDPQSPEERRPAIAGQAIALASYLLVAVIFTFPLIGRLTTHFPSANLDVYQFIWNNWWIYHAVTSLHTTPYLTHFIFAPAAVDLRLHTLGLLYGLLSIPIMPILGPIGVLNIQILATIVLNGYAMYRLVTRITSNGKAGFLSGLLMASTPAIDFHLGVGRPSCAAIWAAIFAIDCFLRLIDRPRWRTAFMLAGSLIATMMADQLVTLFCGFWLCVLSGYLLISRPRDITHGRVLLLNVAVLGLVLIPAYVLYWIPFVDTARYTVPGAVEAFRYSYPLRFFWTPSALWRVYGTMMPIGLLAALWLARRASAIRPWLFGSSLFLCLSLGPVVMGTSIPLPFSAVRVLPMMAQFRTPYRFQIAAAVGLAVIVGGVLADALEHIDERRGRWLVAGAIALVMGDLLAYRVIVGFPTRTMPQEQVYDEIARDARDVLVLEIPVGVHTGTDLIGPGESLVFYQTIHHKRLLSGSAARGPLETLDYCRSSPAIMFFADEPQPPGDLLSDLRQRLHDLNVGYVVIHPGMMNQAWLENTLDLFNGISGLRRLNSITDTIAFELPR